MSLERGGNLPAFQVEVFGWGGGCILVKKGVLDTRSLEVLEIVEADDAGSLILCDVVEWAGGHRAPVELHFCQTVDVASILSYFIGREWIIPAALPILICRIFVIADICLVDDQTICRNNRYSRNTDGIVWAIREMYLVDIAVIDAPYQQAISWKRLVPAFVSDVLEKKEFSLGSFHQLLLFLNRWVGCRVILVDAEIIFVHISLYLVGF